MTKIGTMEVEVGVTLAPLDTDQTKRVLALNVAKDVLTGGLSRPSTEALLDLADYIVGPEPCPLSGLVAIALDPAPAEPEVITVRGVRGLNSLPVGSVVEFPGVGRYYQLTHGRWTHEAWLSESKPHSIPAFALSSTTHVLVEYIPGGV